LNVIVFPESEKRGTNLLCSFPFRKSCRKPSHGVKLSVKVLLDPSLVPIGTSSNGIPDPPAAAPSKAPALSLPDGLCTAL